MGASVPSHATAEMLGWARKSSGYTPEQVEELDKIPVATLKLWEDGAKMPSFAQLQKLAARYKYPLMVFYLESPPKGFSVVKDFRTVASAGVGKFSSELRVAIRAAQERQAWAATYLREEGFPEFSHIGSISLTTNPELASQQIRDLLKFPIHKQLEITRDNDSLAAWKRHCEAAGVYVFSASTVSVKEMRGFALPDNYAPTVVFNSHESYGAKTFTIIHELVHVLLGEAGVSGSYETEIAPFEDKSIERFCNRVAAETLVPIDDFKASVPRDWKGRPHDVIRSLARRYWVSRAAILLRLVETGFASREFYKENIGPLLTPPKPGGGPIPQHKIALSRNGEAFTKLALGAFHTGDIHGGQLASLLGMRLQHLTSLESQLSPMRLQRAGDLDI